MRLLVAEDQKDLNDIITKTLIRNHYTVDSCFDGRRHWIIWKWRNMTP